MEIDEFNENQLFSFHKSEFKIFALSEGLFNSGELKIKHRSFSVLKVIFGEKFNSSLFEFEKMVTNKEFGEKKIEFSLSLLFKAFKIYMETEDKVEHENVSQLLKIQKKKEVLFSLILFGLFFVERKKSENGEYFVSLGINKLLAIKIVTKKDEDENVQINMTKDDGESSQLESLL